MVYLRARGTKKKKCLLASVSSILALLLGLLGMVQPLPACADTGAFIVQGDSWAYYKGTAEPPADWNVLGFDDSDWLHGPTGIGYGDDDDATVLDDMQYNYMSVYLRRHFTAAAPASLSELLLKIDYDDGFVAYLNGIEIARRNLGAPGTPVPYDAATTTGHEAGAFETIEVSDHLSDLITGSNVLAVQVHNADVNSTDLSMIPELHWVDNLGTIHLLRYPYLQMLGTDTVTVVWTTSEPGPAEVRYSTDLSHNHIAPAVSTLKLVDASPPYDNYYEHAATLSGLAADTTYNYAIYTQGTRLAKDDPLHFQTHPGIGPDVCTFDFAVVGDTIYNYEYSQEVRDQALARGFDFMINLGDLAYVSATYDELEENFFHLFEVLLWNRMVWPTLGNHEYVTDNGAPYLDVFHLPEQALRPQDHERYYSFDYGNAHLVFLDTETPLYEISDTVWDDMADWLEADLIANDSFWTIVSMHVPWYVSDDRWHPSMIRTWLVPLFEQYGVDIVFQAHDHLYERTFPIKDDSLSTVADGGVVYVTNGESGGNGTDYEFYYPAPDWSAVRHNHNYLSYGYASYTHIYVDNGIMSLITIDREGDVIDPVDGADPVVIIERSGEPGALCTASISGSVYEDTDGDETFSPGDTPLADVQITLSNGLGTLSTSTTVTGAYQFGGLAPGNYTIAESDPPGYASVRDVQGANDNLISISLASGGSTVGQDFLDCQLPTGVTLVSFTFDPSAPLEDDLVTFTANITPDTATPPVVYTWSFGDGSDELVTTAPVIEHTFDTVGTYTVELTATNGYGTAAYSDAVEVDGRPLTSVSFAFDPTAPLEQESVTFTADYVPDGATLPVSFVWDFGDGSDQVVTATLIVEHVFDDDTPGTYTVWLTATNGYGSPVVYSDEVTVTPVNDPPDAVDDSATVAEGGTVSTLASGDDSVLDNDSDVEGDNLTVDTTPLSGPSHGSLLLHADGTFSYSHDGSETTGDSFTYQVCDDGTPSECAVAAVGVTVTPVNDPPDAVDDDKVLAATNRPVSVEVLRNDSDVEGDTLLLVSFDSTSANGGSVTRDDHNTPGDLSDDLLIYTPAADFGGIDSFTYTISDGNGGTDTATVTVTVTRVFFVYLPIVAGRGAW